MSKFFLLITIFFLSVSVYALDGVYMGFSAEANGNTADGTAAGFGWSVGIDVNRYLGLGMKTTLSYDFDSISSMEQSGLLRFYLPFNKQGLFFQAEAGGCAYYDENESHFYFLSGISAGWRFVIKESFYIEPYVRGGFPFTWGSGLTAGIMLSDKSSRGAIESAVREARREEE